MHTNAGISGELEDLLLVLIAELEGCEAVLLPIDEVGLDHRGEHWEAVLDIEGGVVAIGVDTCTCPAASAVPPWHDDHTTVQFAGEGEAGVDARAGRRGGFLKQGHAADDPAWQKRGSCQHG